MILRAWFSAFVFTQLIEVPIVWFVFFGPWWHAAYLSKLVAAEVFAWLAEAAYFRVLFGKKRALLWALVANASSLSLGMLSRHLFGIP